MTIQLKTLFAISAVLLITPSVVNESEANTEPTAIVEVLHNEVEIESLPEVTVTIPQDEIEIISADTFE